VNFESVVCKHLNAIIMWKEKQHSLTTMRTTRVKCVPFNLCAVMLPA
jgi:hypothetical protein